MELNEYENLKSILNAKLEKCGRKERFEITAQTVDGETYYFLTVKNPLSDELSIEMTYDDEWTVYFLGIHDHLYSDVFYGDDETFADEILKRYIIPVFENRVVHVCHTETGVWCGSSIEVIPEDIPFEFTKEELPDPQTCNILCWQGEVTDEKIRAFAVSERKEVEDFKINAYVDLFE